MIFDGIRRNFSTIALCTLVFSFVFWVRSFADSTSEESGFEYSVFASPSKWMNTAPTLRLILSMLVTMILGMGLYQLSVNHLFMRGREHLLAPIFVVSVGAFPFLHSLTGVHLASVFVLLSFNGLFACYRNEYNLFGIFSAFMYIGLASLFYSFALILIFPGFIGLLRFKSVGLRDIIIVIAGLLCPYYFASFVSYFVGGDFMFPAVKTAENLVPEFGEKLTGLTVFQYVFTLCAVVFIVMEILKYMGATHRGMTQKAVSCNIIFFQYFVSCSVAVILFMPHGRDIVMIASIPGTVIVSNFFASVKRNRSGNVFFALFFVTALVSCYVKMFQP